MSFEGASRVSGGPGRWRADVAEGWDILGVTNGGYLMSMATRAMSMEADGRTLVSAIGSFANRTDPGLIDIDVEELKTGRSMSTLRATISREGRDLVYVTGVFSSTPQTVRDDDLAIGEPPDLPPPSECVPAEPATNGAPFPPPFTGKVELRIHPLDAGAMTGNRTGIPEMRGWFRLRDDEPMDEHAVVLACDAHPPAIFNADLTIGWTPTIDLAVQVRQPAPSGWLACRFSTRFVTGGLLEEDGEIWDESGRLVALSRQLALVPRG